MFYRNGGTAVRPRSRTHALGHRQGFRGLGGTRRSSSGCRTCGTGRAAPVARKRLGPLKRGPICRLRTTRRMRPCTSCGKTGKNPSTVGSLVAFGEVVSLTDGRE